MTPRPTTPRSASASSVARPAAHANAVGRRIARLTDTGTGSQAARPAIAEQAASAAARTNASDRPTAVATATAAASQAVGPAARPVATHLSRR